MPNIDKQKRQNKRPSSEEKTSQLSAVASSDAPLVDSALADIRERRARQAAVVGPGARGKPRMTLDPRLTNHVYIATGTLYELWSAQTTPTERMCEQSTL